MVYRSKIDWWIVALIAAMLLGVTLPGILEGAWLLLLINLIVAAFIGNIYYNTYYEIRGDELYVVSSWLVKYRIDIHRIQRIQETNDPFSAPALSLDRLRLDFGQGNAVLVSPKDKEGFIRHIQDINPAVKLLYKSKKK